MIKGLIPMANTEALLRILSITADALTLISLVSAAVFAFMRRNENVLALKISLFMSYVFRAAIIVLFLTILFSITNWVYYLLLMPSAHNLSMGQPGYYWRDDMWIEHTIAYFIAYAIGLTIAWIGSNVIWAFSWNPAKRFVNIFRSDNKLPLKQKPGLEIISAIYGTKKGQIDITQKARDMVVDNQLTITASNNISGDPDVGSTKTLTISYKVGGVGFEKVINEHETLSIPGPSELN